MDLSDNLIDEILEGPNAGIEVEKMIPPEWKSNAAKVLEMHGFLRHPKKVTDPAELRTCEARFDAALIAAGKSVITRKGLFVFGPPGTGKSRFLAALLSLHRHEYFDLKNDSRWRFLDLYGESGYEWYARKLKDADVVIDDFGAHKLKNDYGQRSDIVLEFMLYHIHENLRKERKNRNRLFITSNLYGKEFEELYGGRADALREALHPLYFKGESLRRWE